MNQRIYLDNNATTGVDPKVAAIMLENLSSTPANPSSAHYFGQMAKQKLIQARQTISTFLNVKPSEIIFTSGGTESMNLLIRGLVDAKTKPHILTSNIEHSCVRDTIQDLCLQGCEATFLPVGLYGAAKVEEIEKAIMPHTRLLVFSAANNETGVKHDIEAIGSLAERCGIPFVVDGVALLGKELFSIPSGITGMGFSAHKLHGPKGVGFAFVRSYTKLKPLLTGGGQEQGLRSGTENLAGILGLAKAIEILKEELPISTLRMQRLRDSLEKQLLHLFPAIEINGTGPRIANTSNLAFPKLDGETILIQLDLAGIAASHGSACASGSLEPSHVLRGMGLSEKKARSSVRFSLSRYTSQEEVDKTISVLVQILKAFSL